MPNTLLHPKCGKRFPDTARIGHCSACCQTFYGLTAFTRHQSRMNGKVVCANPSGDTRYRLDKDGCWRFGPGMDSTLRAKLRRD